MITCYGLLYFVNYPWNKSMWVAFVYRWISLPTFPFAFCRWMIISGGALRIVPGHWQHYILLLPVQTEIHPSSLNHDHAWCPQLPLSRSSQQLFNLFCLMAACCQTSSLRGHYPQLSCWMFKYTYVFRFLYFVFISIPHVVFFLSFVSLKPSVDSTAYCWL